MNKLRFWSLIIIALLIFLGWFVLSSESNPESGNKVKYGLDLSGGTHLVFDADLSSIPAGETSDAMSSLREVIERRVNVFGVSEPLVQVEGGGFGSDVDQRLIVELPGVADVDEAVALIGRTPLLEFKLVDRNSILQEVSATIGDGGAVELDADIPTNVSSGYIDTGLTGALLQRAQLQFGTAGHGGVGPSQPIVVVNFNKEGSDLFEQITRENVGESLAIFLDGDIVSTPRINEPIPGGTAVISGSFGIEEAQQLVKDLNLGALPVPIELSSVQKIGATLGNEARTGGVMAGIIGLLVVSVFLMIRYRLPGVIAVVSLALYLVAMVTLFKLIPVVLTAAGIAGFILSIGMAVDANVLIFERLNEELRDEKKSMSEAIREGFSRAWTSIRDGNLSSLITAIILYWVGTSLVKGFAVTFGLGILISMLTAITVTRTFLLALAGDKDNPRLRRLYSISFGRSKS